MCSRFFIDFPDLTQQQNKLVKFLDNHFQGEFSLSFVVAVYQVQILMIINLGSWSKFEPMFSKYSAFYALKGVVKTIQTCLLL